MKRTIIALSVFAFVFTFATTGSDAVAAEANTYTVVSPADQDPPKTMSKKATAKTAEKKSACCDETAKVSAKAADCNTPCTDKDKSAKAAADCNTPCNDKSAKASTDCDSKKATTTTAAAVTPDVK